MKNINKYFYLNSKEPTTKNKDLEADWKVVVKDIAARCKYALTIPGLVPLDMDYGLKPSDCRDSYRPKLVRQNILCHIVGSKTASVNTASFILINIKS